MSLSKSRLMAMVDIVPEAPEFITPQNIKRELDQRGLGPVSVRTVQRDLQSMQDATLKRLCLVCEFNDGSPSNGSRWYWSA